MKKNIFLPGFIIFLMLFPCCSKKPDLFQGVVTFISGSLKINDKAAVVGSRVQKNDTLTTADKSLAVIQIAQTALITLHSNTELKVDNLLKNGDNPQVVSLNITRGSTFHKVLVKGTDYSVKTPTAVASVRGTSFEVNVTGTKNRISLLSGVVHISRILDKPADNRPASDAVQGNEVKDVVLTAGQFVESTPEVIGQPVVLARPDMDKLNQLDAITVIPDVEKTIPVKESSKNSGNINDQSAVTPGVAVIPETVKDPILKQELMECGSLSAEEKAKNRRTIYIEKLNDIKIKNNGRLDKITLRNGVVIMGMITERGNTYKVVTPDGTIEVMPVNIESQTITH